MTSPGIYPHWLKPYSEVSFLYLVSVVVKHKTQLPWGLIKFNLIKYDLYAVPYFPASLSQYIAAMPGI